MHLQTLLRVAVLSVALTAGWTRTVPSPVPSTVSSVTPAEIAKNSTPCAIDVESLCREVEEDHGDYMIKVGTHFFRESGELQVKVHLASCPWHIKASPWWYQLTAVVSEPADSDPSEVSQDVSNSASFQPHEKKVEPEISGGFIPVNPSQEIHLCDANKRTVFTSCSPSPMDFPMMYIWKALTNYNDSDTICFRLLLKQDGHTACKLVQKCYTVVELLTNSSMDSSLVVDHSITLTSSDTLDEIMSQISDSSSSDSVEDIMDTNFSTAAEKAVSVTGCMSTKKFLHESGISWEPSCDCQGYYKSVQCRKAESDDTQVCWCSTRGGSEKFNTRKTLTCDSAMKFEC